MLMFSVCVRSGPGSAADGSGEWRAADYILRSAHHGSGHVWSSGPDNHAGAHVWSSRTSAGKCNSACQCGESYFNRTIDCHILNSKIILISYY